MPQLHNIEALGLTRLQSLVVVASVLQAEDGVGLLVLGGFTSNPTARPDGQALRGGELIYRRDLDAFYGYKGTAATWGTLGGGGGGGVTDHGDLTGLTDDDHAIYSVLAPTASTRNTLQGTSAGITPLRIDQFAGQTADLQQWRDDVGGVGAKVTSGFKIFGLGLDAGSQAIENVGDPVNPQDAATKAFVAAVKLNELAVPDGDVDFGEQQAVDFCLENRTSDPEPAEEGRIWIRTDL